MHVRITPPTIDATSLYYNAMFTDRTGKNSLNSTFSKTQENLNGTRNLTQQDIQTPSHFINEEVVEIMPTTTQQSISPIHPTLTTPQNKSTTSPQTTTKSPQYNLLLLKDNHKWIIKHLDQQRHHDKQRWIRH